MSDAVCADVKPRVAVVVPCYQSVQSLQPLARRLCIALAARGYPFELIFVDDASPDEATWNTLKVVKDECAGVARCFRLARNVGQHNAIQCGFAQLSPSIEIVVTMDDDLQHRPEDVPTLVVAVDEGADLAIGAYDDKRHARWRNVGGGIVDACLRGLFNLPRGFDLTSFRAVRRYAVDDALANSNRYMYLTAALLLVTRRRVNVPVSHQQRSEGRSGYSLAKSLELSANLFLSYSRWPLYFIVVLFLFSLLVAVSITAWVFWKWLVMNQVAAGWTSTMMLLGTTNAFTLAALAVIALLVTRSHRQLVGGGARWRVAEHA